MQSIIVKTKEKRDIKDIIKSTQNAAPGQKTLDLEPIKERRDHESERP